MESVQAIAAAKEAIDKGGDSDLAKTARNLQSAFIAGQTAYTAAKLIGLATAASTSFGTGFYGAMELGVEYDEKNQKTRFDTHRNSLLVAKNGDIDLSAKKDMTIKGGDII